MQQLLYELEKSSWYRDIPEVREFGLRVQIPTDLSERALSAAAADVLVAGMPEVGLDILRRLPAPLRPRLLVFLDRRFPHDEQWKLPPGVAALRLPDFSSSGRLGDFFRAFVYGLIHDFPLHEAVKVAITEVHPDFTPILTADPSSNQSLRIIDALTDLKQKGDAWAATLPSVDFVAFLDRLEKISDPRTRARLSGVRKRAADLHGESAPNIQQLRSWVSSTRTLPVLFTHESDSLVPMAYVRAQRARLGNDEVALLSELRRFAQDPEVSELLRAHQQRFVDVALARLETQPLLEAVSRSTTLQSGRLYQLRVHIGHRLEDSIVVGPAVPIDPLLPDPEAERGHQLEIAIQSKEFDLLSEPARSTWLPRFGASEPVYFRIRAPENSGKKHMRVCIYCQNYMIQSYEFYAEVAKGEYPGEHNQELLGVRLEFSRTESFADLQQFRHRLISVGANSTGSSPTHELIVKGDQASGEITLFPSTYDQEVKNFRDTLEAASKDPVNPKLTRVYPPVYAGQSPTKDVAQTFRDLARQGSDLYDAVFGKASRSNLRQALVKVKQSSDQKLQVVRFDDNFVFPWAILYDFLLPDEVTGQAQSPVCLGVTVDADGNSVPCNHTYKDKVYCVNGFWGVRHYVEELIGQGTNTNPQITRAASDAVRIVADATLGGVSGLIQNLTNAIGSAQVKPGPVDADLLLDLLWADPPQRPSILIVVGHLQKSAVANEPQGARVVLVPHSKWLLRKKISERCSLDSSGWGQPRSLVLMMACESAATEVATINDFVTAWNTAGAGAIIGTECIVGSGLAAQLAEEVTRDLWAKKTLGEAMTRFRRQEVNRGNPLGLVFHAVGDVDLTVN